MQKYGYQLPSFLQEDKKPEQQFASVAGPANIKPASFQSAPKTENYKEPTKPSVVKQAMQSYAPAIQDESESFKGLTREEEGKLLTAVGGNKYKAMDVYPSILQKKQDRYFLEDRQKQLSKTLYDAQQSKDPTKLKLANRLFKLSQAADFVRQQALDSGTIGVSLKSDEDIIGSIVSKSPLGTEKATQLLSDYIGGKTGIEVVDQIFTGKEPVVEEEKGFLAKTAEDIKSRFSGFYDSMKDVSVKDLLPNLVGGSRVELRGAGALAGAANDVIGNAISSLTKSVGLDEPIGNVIKKITDSEIGQKGLELLQQGDEAFSQFEAIHPKQAQDIKDIRELAQVAPVPFVGGKVASKVDDVIGDVSRVAGNTERVGIKKSVANIIAEPETKKTIQKAIQQGRLEETAQGKIKRVLFGDKASTIKPTPQIQEATDIIVKNIKKPASTPGKLYGQIDEVVNKRSNELSTKLKDIQVPKPTTKDPITKTLKSDIKELVSLTDEFTNTDISKINGVYSKILKASNLDEVWNIRKDWDSLFSEAVKQADNVSAPTTRKANALWKSTRNILNDYVDKVAENTTDEGVKAKFREMSALFKAKSNILNSASKDYLKPSEGLISTKNMVKTGLGLAGYDIYQKLTK